MDGAASRAASRPRRIDASFSRCASAFFVSRYMDVYLTRFVYLTLAGHAALTGRAVAKPFRAVVYCVLTAAITAACGATHQLSKENRLFSSACRAYITVGEIRLAFIVATRAISLTHCSRSKKPNVYVVRRIAEVVKPVLVVAIVAIPHFCPHHLIPQEHHHSSFLPG